MDGIAFTSVELLEHSCKVVILLDGMMVIPHKPLLKQPGVPMLRKISTEA